MSNAKINIAILGFGVVGKGTAEVLSRMQDPKSAHRRQANLNLKYILVRRDFPDSPYQDCMVKDSSVIFQDPDLQIVVECMGGLDVAYSFTKQALSAGKSVVTSNKELVATHGYELLALAQEHQCNYLFEAAVGGGIPVLRPITNCLAGNNLLEIRGILNGTSNYILSKMKTESLSYEKALSQAQALGFAEQDPTADVDGHDSCRKITILGNLLFGGTIDTHSISTQGIRSIHDEDTVFSNWLSMTFKLVARAFKGENGANYAVVAPHLCPEQNPFSHIDNATNIVELLTDSLGVAHFVGQGAGALPTASAIVGDICDLSKDSSRNRENGWSNTAITLSDMDEVPMDYYIRLDMPSPDFARHCSTNGLDYTHLLVEEILSSEDFEDWGKNTSVCLAKNRSKKELETTFSSLPVASIFPILSTLEQA